MIHKFAHLFCTAALLLVGFSRLLADDSKQADVPVKKLILPGESFSLDGRPAFILWPAEEKRQQPQPWIMYSPTLPGTPDSHEKWMHEQFLAAGVAVAGVDVGEAYGSPSGQKHFTTLYRELTSERGLAAKPCLLGRSRGGLWASSWAIRNADKVAGFAGIYPVFDLRTYPGLKRAASAYELTPEELEATLDEHNPIAKIDMLAKEKVPVFIIHGDIDKVVPLKENSATLVERYKQAGAGDLVDLVVVEGQGHNYFPGFFRCQELVDFVIRQAKSGGMAESDGLAAEQTDINSRDTSYQREQKISYLKQPVIDSEPDDLNDGIAVSSLARCGCDETAITKLLEDIHYGKYGNIDSLLISSNRKLVLESYFRRGRADFPHYQMSITKSITALALGRAMQLGYITDLDTPVVDYLKNIDRSQLVSGAAEITVADCLNMHSGIRIPSENAKRSLRQPQKLKGQGQAQIVLEVSNPVTENSKVYKYQGTDPSLVMQVIEAIVPGTAEKFIKKEVFGQLGISNYAWQLDVSGFPKAAAGSSLRSRDMLKLGMLITGDGKWNGEQLWETGFIRKAVSPIYTNKAGHSYGYFWWGSEVEVDGKKHRCISARGAGGQFIFMMPTLDFIVIVTSHNKAKAMRYPFELLKERILPAFAFD